MVVIEEFFVREEDEDDGTRTRGASRRVVSRAWGGRFGSFGFYRFGSVSIGSVLGCLGDAFVVYCVLGVPNHPYVGGLE